MRSVFVQCDANPPEIQFGGVEDDIGGGDHGDGDEAARLGDRLDRGFR